MCPRLDTMVQKVEHEATHFTHTYRRPHSSLGPTADICEKGDGSMSESLRPYFCKKVQTYLRSCEHLLSIAAVCQDPPFSPDELLVVNHYTAEVPKMVEQLAKV